MKKVILYWILVGFSITLGVYASKWIGQNWVKSPADLRSLATGDCLAPCWEGLQVGISDYPDTLPDHPDFLETVRANRADKVGQIILHPTHLILLGDLVVVWGYPSHIRMRHVVLQNNIIGIIAVAYFQDGLVEVRLAYATNTLPIGRLSPHMRVLKIDYFAPSIEGSIVPLGTPRWRGFGAIYLLER